jgi:putative GTP pyrophosphokinase
VNELKEAAGTAARLDRKMETIHKEMIQLKELAAEEESNSQNPLQHETLQRLLTNKFNKI